MPPLPRKKNPPEPGWLVTAVGRDSGGSGIGPGGCGTKGGQEGVLAVRGLGKGHREMSLGATAWDGGGGLKEGDWGSGEALGDPKREAGGGQDLGHPLVFSSQLIE